MKRIACTERADWRAKAEAQGFAFHTLNGERYWDESAAYVFTLEEIEADLEQPTAELHALAMDVAGRIVESEELLTRLAIPPVGWDAIRNSWLRGDQTLYGRFDFAYGGAGTGPAKLLEYNADTPTALYETAVFQWGWLEDMLASGAFPEGTGQFNSLHDKLIARFADIGPGQSLHFTCMDDAPEDRGTVAYLEDCAVQAGLVTRFTPLGQIGHAGQGPFLDQDDQPIPLLFKLYPWEWIFVDPFGEAVASATTQFIEPPWKAVLSNKGILPLLWEAAPGHPNLLECYFEDDPQKLKLGKSFAKKPLYSREGANVTLIRDAVVIGQGSGPYGSGGHVRQALADIPVFDGAHAVIGSWIVGDEPAGICLREADGPITTNTSRFVPHIIQG